MIGLREYSVCSGFPCCTVSFIQEMKGDSFFNFHFADTALVEISLQSFSSTKRIEISLSGSSAISFSVISWRTRGSKRGSTRETHSRYVISCCLIPVGICGLKNNSRRITYWIGCVWGIPSLSPVSSLARTAVRKFVRRETFHGPSANRDYRYKKMICE